MRRIATLALLALASSGCIGSSASTSTGGPSSDSHPAVPWSKTVLTITYYARHCPPGARCPGSVKSFDNRTFVRVTRQLDCDPAGPGAARDYSDPTAACAALREVVAKLATKNWVCGCATGLHPGEKAVGVYEGKRRTIPLDGCSLCNLRGIAGDLAVLMPGADR